MLYKKLKTFISIKREGVLKNYNGITLIALIITIIVLLIISGVAISIITGQDGLFSKANLASNKYIDSQISEADKFNSLNSTLELYALGKEIEISMINSNAFRFSIDTTETTIKVTGNMPESSKITYEYQINEETPVQAERITSTTYTFTNLQMGSLYTIRMTAIGENGERVEAGNNGQQVLLEYVTLADVSTVEEAITKNAKAITTNRNLTTSDNKTMIVPAGFTIASDSAISTANGIVVEDASDNQFVWIPVDNISDYKRTDFGKQTSGTTYSEYSEIMPSEEYASVNYNKGFYIGRYETGGTENSLTIKSGENPYVNISQLEAKTKAEVMDTIKGYTNGTFTKICSSYAWDTTLTYIGGTYATNSSQGNYIDNGSGVLLTGQTTPACNIYDMGGNVWEFTTEDSLYYNSNYANSIYVTRGGSCTYPSDRSAGWRARYSGSEGNDYGFRVTLYLDYPLIDTVETVANAIGLKPTNTNITLTTGDDKEVTIPAGFIVAGDSDVRAENGIVIQDANGNQFVWIPVDNISDYKRTNFGKQDGNYNNYSESLNDDEKESVKENKGYYIGRFEAGDKEITDSNRMRTSTDTSTDTLTIKARQAPYNYISYNDAKIKAEGMDTAEGYTNGTFTRLCSSYAWDKAICFIQNKVSNYGTSSQQGNYSDSPERVYRRISGQENAKTSSNTSSNWLIPTGSTIAVCNIYDMGGNVNEYTSEISNRTVNNISYVNGLRGRGYMANYTVGAGYRGATRADHAGGETEGFRVTLFLGY